MSKLKIMALLSHGWEARLYSFNMGSIFVFGIEDRDHSFDAIEYHITSDSRENVYYLSSNRDSVGKTEEIILHEESERLYKFFEQMRKMTSGYPPPLILTSNLKRRAKELLLKTGSKYSFIAEEIKIRKKVLGYLKKFSGSPEMINCVRSVIERAEISIKESKAKGKNKAFVFISTSCFNWSKFVFTMEEEETSLCLSLFCMIAEKAVSELNNKGYISKIENLKKRHSSVECIWGSGSLPEGRHYVDYDITLKVNIDHGEKEK